MNQPIYPEVTVWDVFLFQRRCVERAEIGQEVLTTATPATMRGEMLLFIAGGIVQTLASLEEAWNVIAELLPRAAADRDASFDADFRHWREFRDDAAHPADRGFRFSQPRQHDAQVPDPAWGRNIDLRNMIVLCVNCHKMLHYAANKVALAADLCQQRGLPTQPWIDPGNL
jgi:hypothetical protein